MGWMGPSNDRLLRAAEYVVEQWMKSPLWQNWLAIQNASLQAAAEARLAQAIAQLRTASLAAASLELALTMGVPIAAWVGVFVALGAPYAEAKALVQNSNFKSGYSQGFVTGLLKWEWQHTVSRFFKFGPGFNAFDSTLSYIASNSYNEGLRAGYVQACMFPEAARVALLSRLKAASPQTNAGRWDRLAQISYVIELATAGIRTGVFKSG